MHSRFRAALLVAFVFVWGSAQASLPLAASSSAQRESTLLVWGGETTWHFNPDELRALGLELVDVKGATTTVVGVPGKNYGAYTFPALNQSSLEIRHSGAAVTGIGGGSLLHSGGFRFSFAGGAVDLRGFALRARAGSVWGVEVVDSNGVVWLTADHAHYGFVPKDDTRFSMRRMNLSLAPAFAHALGNDALAGRPIGGLDFVANAANQAKSLAAPEGTTCDAAPWPTTGLVTDVAMIVLQGQITGHDDAIYPKRCGIPGAGGTYTTCTDSSTDGEVVLSLDSSPKNIGQTKVAWYDRQNGGPTPLGGANPPYNNGQHPLLVWNLYRVDVDGRIRQIGGSGVKHAYYTVNFGCHDAGNNACPAGDVMYPSCEDTYSHYDNDDPDRINGGNIITSVPSVFGARSEVVPVNALWGSCGSDYDNDCDGVPDALEPNPPAQPDLYHHRLLVREADMLSSMHPDAKYFLEYWYLVRDDQNIYDSMANRQFLVHKQGSNWYVDMIDDRIYGHGFDSATAYPAGADFSSGPMINRWVSDSSPPPNASNRELAVSDGHVRVASKATAIGGGLWRYEYAVMNFDFARSITDSTNAHGVRVLTNHGFQGFSVTLPASVSVSNVAFDDADDVAGNAWTSGVAANTVTWSAPGGASPTNTLDWGYLYHFEFTSTTPPGAAGSVSLQTVTTASQPQQSYTLTAVVPGAN